MAAQLFSVRMWVKPLQTKIASCDSHAVQSDTRDSYIALRVNHVQFK